MTIYNIYVGAKFEISNGQPFSVYEVLDITDTHVTYTDIISDVPRYKTKKEFVEFLEKSQAIQVK